MRKNVLVSTPRHSFTLSFSFCLYLGFSYQDMAILEQISLQEDKCPTVLSIFLAADSMNATLITITIG